MKKLITIMTLFLIAFQIYAGEIVETDNVTYTNCSVSIVGTGQLNVGTGVVNQARVAAWDATDAELAVLQTQVDDLQTGTNAAFLVTDSAGGRVGLYTTFDAALAACPDDGLTECIRLGQYDWTYNVLPSNGVTVLGHGGLTLHQTNENSYIVLSESLTNTFDGVTFRSSTTNTAIAMASLFVFKGELTLEHCTFTNALSPAIPGLGLNGGTANLRDTDLQGLIHQFGGASTVNDNGGSVWSSTTVGTTNYFGSALTVGGYTAAQLRDGAKHTNRPFVITCIVSTNDPAVYPCGPAVTSLVITNIEGWLAADSATFHLFSDAVQVYTSFTYAGSETNLPVNIPIAGGAHIQWAVATGSPTNTPLTLWGTY